MTNLKKLKELPELLNIVTLRNKKTGVWIAQLIDYDICTEADSFFELLFNVNDLVYAYFDIPRSLQSKITYLPPQVMQGLEENSKSLEAKMTFNMLVAPKLLDYRHA